MSMSSRAPIYLDNAATTALLPEALEAMTACYLQPGNASSLTVGRHPPRHLLPAVRRQHEPVQQQNRVTGPEMQRRDGRRPGSGLGGA
ncbi:hypothetical protein [Gordonia aichiensis]